MSNQQPLTFKEFPIVLEPQILKRQHKSPPALESYHNPIQSTLSIVHKCKIILLPQLSLCLNTASQNFIHYRYYASHAKLCIWWDNVL